ncbi:MAG: hypothetical protein ACJARJ_000224 [Neptuniibacter pectenicola]
MQRWLCVALLYSALSLDESFPLVDRSRLVEALMLERLAINLPVVYFSVFLFLLIFVL